MVFFSLLPYTTIFDAIPLACRLRFSVTSPVQNAPFGHVEVASPAQSASLRKSPVAEWGTCVRCRAAVRRDVNPH